MSETAISWVLFDLNGTLLDLSGIAQPLGGGDADRRLVAAAFQEALLLTMADTLSGGDYRPLPEHLRATLERALRSGGRDLSVLDPAMQRAAAMDAFPEAGSALSRLGGAGLNLGVLTNSSTDAAEQALAAAGLRHHFDVVMGSDEVRKFKPHPHVYEHAVQRLDTAPAEIALVAAHAWDVMGAMRAGLRGAWAAHSEHHLVAIVPAPDVTGDNLDDVAEKIVARLVSP